MPNRLSHSSINKYLQCGESYRLHYKEGYRPKEISSALIFGSALGKAFEWKLKEYNGDSDIVTIFGGASVSSAKDVFDYYWRYQEINGTLTNIEECDDIAWSKYDWDKDLADDVYESMRIKAHLMIDTFTSEFLPLVTKVLSTEEKIELSNEDGDMSIGYSDAVVSIIGHDKPVVIDFKSASRAYELDSARNSVQLSQYLHILGPKYDTRNVGYVVFLKNINKNKTKVCASCDHDGTGSRARTCDKTIVFIEDFRPNRCIHISGSNYRCNGIWKDTIKPKADMQVIIDTIPENFENMVIDNIEAVNHGIKNNVFVKNLNVCHNIYGRKCEFFNKCHKSTDNGLVKVGVK